MDSFKPLPTPASEPMPALSIPPFPYMPEPPSTWAGHDPAAQQRPGRVGGQGHQHGLRADSGPHLQEEYALPQTLGVSAPGWDHFMSPVTAQGFLRLHQDKAHPDPNPKETSSGHCPPTSTRECAQELRLSQSARHDTCRNYKDFLVISYLPKPEHSPRGVSVSPPLSLSHVTKPFSEKPGI